MIANILSKTYKIALLLLIYYLFFPTDVLATTIIFELDATPKNVVFELNATPIKETSELTIYTLYSEEEIQLLFRTVETETHGADYESKKNVASVILNRQEQYRKSLKEIITAPNQFCYTKNNITDSTIQACEDALNNRGNVSNALYFRSDKCPETWNGRPFLYSDSNHNFY